MEVQLPIQECNHHGMTDDEDAEEQFLEESRSIMKQFVLCMDNDTDLLDRSPEERDRMTRFHKQVPVDDKAKQVAMRIREIGDQLDSKLKGKMKEAITDMFTDQSVWEIGYTQFSETCSGILSSCHGCISNGWEQMSVVYTVAGHLISELTYQQDDVGLRQTQMEGYTGTYLSEMGLQEWTMQRGGISEVSSYDLSENTTVPIDAYDD